jgi:hypothetical protein
MYHFLDADGRRVESGEIQIIDTSSQNGPGMFQIDLGADGRVILHPVFASTPVKMLARDECESLLVGSSYRVHGNEVTVFGQMSYCLTVMKLPAHVGRTAEPRAATRPVNLTM